MNNEIGYLQLFYAIVRRAAFDYCEKTDEEIKEFLCSNWFGKISTCDGEYIYRKIKENYINHGKGIDKIKWIIPKSHFKK